MPRNKLSKFEQEARNAIASNLKKYMRGMTQADLAYKADIPVTTLSGYLRAKSTPNAGNLEKLAMALNVNKSDIDPRYSFEDIMDFVNKAPEGTYIHHDGTPSNISDIDKEHHKDDKQDNTAVTWADLGMPYGGTMPEELKETYADIAKGYFKRHPEYLNKNVKDEDEDED